MNLRLWVPILALNLMGQPAEGAPPSTPKLAYEIAYDLTQKDPKRALTPVVTYRVSTLESLFGRKGLNVEVVSLTGVQASGSFNLGFAALATGNLAKGVSLRLGPWVGTSGRHFGIFLGLSGQLSP